MGRVRGVVDRELLDALPLHRRPDLPRQLLAHADRRRRLVRVARRCGRAAQHPRRRVRPLGLRQRRRGDLRQRAVRARPLDGGAGRRRGGLATRRCVPRPRRAHFGRDQRPPVGPERRRVHREARRHRTPAGRQRDGGARGRGHGRPRRSRAALLRRATRHPGGRPDQRRDARRRAALRQPVRHHAGTRRVRRAALRRGRPGRDVAAAPHVGAHARRRTAGDDVGERLADRRPATRLVHQPQPRLGGRSDHLPHQRRPRRDADLRWLCDLPGAAAPERRADMGRGSGAHPARRHHHGLDAERELVPARGRRAGRDERHGRRPRRGRQPARRGRPCRVAGRHRAAVRRRGARRLSRGGRRHRRDHSAGHARLTATNRGETHMRSSRTAMAIAAVAGLIGALATAGTATAPVAHAAAASDPWRDSSYTPRPGQWQPYVLAPDGRQVDPIAVSADPRDGSITGDPNALLNGKGWVRLTNTGDRTTSPLLTLDFGKEVGGKIQVYVTRSSATPPQLHVCFSESRRYTALHPQDNNGEAAHAPGCDTANIWNGYPGVPYTYDNDSHLLPLDGAQLPATITDPQLRGGFRYATLFLDGAGSVTVDRVSLQFGAVPSQPDPAAYRGWFLSSDNTLDKIWYAGAYTVQIDTWPSNTAKSWPYQTGEADHADAQVPNADPNQEVI